MPVSFQLMLPRPDSQRFGSEKPIPGAPTPVPSPTPAPPPINPVPPGNESPPPEAPSPPPTDPGQDSFVRSPNAIDLQQFNALVGDWVGDPIDDIQRLFVRQVILDNQTRLDVETIKVPGFIGIADELQVTDPTGKVVSGHAEIARILERDGLLIHTLQWNRERYGFTVDLRQPLDKNMFLETVIKNEGHHSGAIVPAQRFDPSGKLIPSFATLNEPDDYHQGMYFKGDKHGYMSVAQRLVFPGFVTPTQARGYINSIICWMALMNPFVKFPKENYNGNDPTRIANRERLRQFVKHALLASLREAEGIAFFKDPANLCYCAEFVFISLNTPLYPFNKPGLTELLDGDVRKAEQVLEMRNQQNRRQPNPLSEASANPEFTAFNIPMPVVPEDLLPLDRLMAQNQHAVNPDSLPFPPFKISQVLRRAFHTLLPRHQFSNDVNKLAKAEEKLLKCMEPAVVKQLGLEHLPEGEPTRLAVSNYTKLVRQQLERPYASYEEFDRMVDGLMTTADQMLSAVGDRAYFVPPRIYVDLGQGDGDPCLPQGWGFKLETVGALVDREVLN